MNAHGACVAALCLAHVGAQAWAPATPADANAPPELWQAAPSIGLRVHFGLFTLVDHGVATDTSADAAEARRAARVQEDMTHRFQAHGFDPREWARIAKDAGASWLVFPAKARDGFCLYRSPQTEFDVMASAHDRDMLRVAARACQGEGLHLGVAYAIADAHQARTARSPESDERYLNYVRAQLNELCDGYAPAFVQMYAIDANAKAAPWRELAASLHARTPHVAVLGDAGAPGADACDAVLWRDGTAAPDSSKQARVLACEIDREGVDRVLDILWHCAVVGGHALLEVSANAEGSLAAAALTKLAALGVWQRCNHEALDGVQALANAGIATNQPLPACTWRTLDGETRVYAFAPGGSTTNELRVPDLGLEPLRACVLGGDAATVTRERDGFVLRWQSVAGIRPVLRLDLRGAWRR